MEIIEPFKSTAIGKTSYRINSIDLLRGLVMIIMALDHTRDLLYKDALTGNPLIVETTTPLLFFTRWITHFCAPVFVFLAGTSAFFQSMRKSKSALSGFLIKRGIWLILIEVIVMSFALTFDEHYSLVALQTIWSIGISMVILGLVIWLPFPAIAALGFLLVLGHNSLDFYEARHEGSFSIAYDLLHRQGIHNLWDNHNLFITYPFLSWCGLMMLGYCFGKNFTDYEKDERKKLLTWIGFGIILFFIVLRYFNIYGDPLHWVNQKNSLFTVLSFINTTKYPPSLLFMCMTIGPAIIFLAWFGDIKNGLSKIITVYGRVPFFYYIVHFFLIHILAMIFFIARGHSFSEGWKTIPANSIFKFVVPGEGCSLGVVYLMWLFVVVSLYPVCKWFGNYKQTHRQWWLSYL